MIPEKPIFAGTFHKTGTILFTNIFQAVAQHLKLRFWIPGREFWASSDPETEAFDICFDGASRFLHAPELFTPDSRAVISIRDPRDVVISSAFYHIDSKEKWVVNPNPRFAGRSYQETLRALADDDARILFEMDHSAARTIRQMMKIDKDDPRIFMTRLDTLLEDRDLEEYRRIFAFLGFAGEALEACLEIARCNSVFSPAFSHAGHVRHTAPAIWKRRFTPALASAFEERFPGVAERLGYEPTPT